VTSIIGRFLEHSRIYYFRNGADNPLDGRFFIGSADWMHRNLSERVEAITPVEAVPLRERLWKIVQLALADRRQAWDMQPDGSYIQRTPSHDNGSTDGLGTQQVLMEWSRPRTNLPLEADAGTLHCSADSQP
jgi:polyphosphate kinase